MEKKRPADPKLLELIKSGPGGGLSRDLLDNAFWRDASRDDIWIAALDRLDRLGDKTALVGLLRSSAPLSKMVRGYLADLIERGVARPRGRKRVPAYTMSQREALLLLAVDSVKTYINEGLSRTKALQKAASQYNLDAALLETAYDGRRGSSRRTKRTS